MKVVAVLGSPRKYSLSSRVAERILDGARDAGHEVVVYKINEMNIKGCQACRYCKENGVDCILEDDLKPYWKDLHECGALIVAAPNYCCQVSGPMITYMNRHYCIMGLNGTTLEPGKIKLIGVFSQHGPVETHYADAAYDWYLGDFLARKMVMTKKFVIGRGENMEEEGVVRGSDVAEDGLLMKSAYALGKSL